MWREAKQVQLIEITEEAIPEENGHTEEEVIIQEPIPEENGQTKEEVITEEPIPADSARSSLPDIQELHFAPKCRKRGRPKGACTTAIGLPKAKKLKKTRCSPFHTLDIQSQQKLVLGWFVTDSVVTDAIQRSHLIGEEEIDVVNIPSQLKDSQVDVNMLRRFFDSDGWKRIIEIIDQIKEEEWKCGECKQVLSSSESIGCDSCLEWNHLTCIKLKKIPKCKYWYCSHCKV